MTTARMPATLTGARIVDLSLLVAEEYPCAWPGHVPYQQRTSNYFTQTGAPEAPLFSPTGAYQTRFLVIDEHTGTHMDAPAHFLPRPETGLPSAHPLGEVTAEQVPLQQLIGPAVVIDVADLLASDSAPGVSPEITPAYVLEWEERHRPIEAGEIVLFRSGWDVLHYQAGAAGAGYAQEPFQLKTAPGWPAPGPDVMQVLIDRGVRCVGTDAPSMGSTHDGAPVHLTGLSQGCVYIEGLANLAALPDTGATFVFAPVKLARGTGAPGRAFAFLP